MTTRTRRFVVASLLVLASGIGAGLASYYLGFSSDSVSAQAGQGELQLIPPDATFVGYVNVRAVMGSALRRQQLRRALPVGQDSQREFEAQTGINIERDVDSVVACLTSAADAAEGSAARGLALIRGRFDAPKIEALMREHGAAVEDYGGRRLIVAERRVGTDQTTGPASERDSWAVTFMEPELVVVGSQRQVRSAIDRGDGRANITGNEEVMTLVRSLREGDMWAVGRFDALTQQIPLPASIAGQLPPITWLTVSAKVNGGLRGVLVAEGRDEASANGLRDMVRGFIALAKIQGPKVPGTQALLQSLELQGTGRTVALSFEAPPELFDLLSPRAERSDPQPGR